ncbi:MAG: hypothetical protein AYK18_09815 [Theionarchaea archaeon DG-70]|nr:MAG: hypothetical protein AYK18_09815 [Theionarchaea archaeon DG-70]
MTLVLSKLTPYGIAMAADTAITVKFEFPDETLERTYADAKKLQKIPQLNAGISWWGEGRINGIFADLWLERFIKNSSAESLEEFAISLQNELRRLELTIPEGASTSTLRDGTIGFHLAGFVEYNNRRIPSLYHIHNGKSVLYPTVDPHIVNANHDFPPLRVIEHWSRREWPGLRNGDYRPYAVLYNYLSGFYRQLHEDPDMRAADDDPFIIPHPLNLETISEFLRFNIKLVRDIYALSNYPPIIGGRVTTLTINENGIRSYSTI